MKRFWFLCFLGFTLGRAAPPPAPDVSAVTNDICVLVGLPGEEIYAPGLAAAAQTWQKKAEDAGAACTVIGLDPPKEGEKSDRDKFHDWISHLNPDSSVPAWIVYLGHGTYDGKETRMNIRGDDISATDLAEWLKPLHQMVIFIDGGSASAPFIAALSGPNRVIITGTQSGREVNYTRFGEKFAEAIANPDADIDQDGETSLLEAFVWTSQQVQNFYLENDRMATEHALLDDNGDKRGTPYDFFNGTEVVKRASQGEPDGSVASLISLSPLSSQARLTADQLKLRTQYEGDLRNLRAQKANLADADYYTQLEKILRELAAVYVKPKPPPPPDASDLPQLSTEPPAALPTLISTPPAETASPTTAPAAQVSPPATAAP